AGAVVLLLEDQPFPQACIAPAELVRPRHHCVARVEECTLPREVRGEAGTRVSRRQRRARDVGLEPGSALGAKGVLFGTEGEIHERRAIVPGPARAGTGHETKPRLPRARYRAAAAAAWNDVDLHL